MSRFLRTNTVITMVQETVATRKSYPWEKPSYIDISFRTYAALAIFRATYSPGFPWKNDRIASGDFRERFARTCPPDIGGCHTALHPSTQHRLSVIARVTQTITLKERIGLPPVSREPDAKTAARQ